MSIYCYSTYKTDTMSVVIQRKPICEHADYKRMHREIEVFRRFFLYLQEAGDEKACFFGFNGSMYGGRSFGKNGGGVF